ncbi:alpha/beta hydrolase [Actinoplanes sp. NEAU-A12]|uniref:Alpha/beta hydrolase n=1 Tax=Actinoplanes sandaracinus TaxID=3045177 RepID=A0ABT6WKE6_9ACTN|nr:alpha/beta hydrolase [Actinoplanes sandaracinus]MDI6100188.1 alpha/beta hydrolase [Actinoplanes sandaracinus]
MSTDVHTPATASASPGRPVRWPLRAARAIVAVIASFLTFLVTAIMVGAWFPAVPKAGVIGPVLAGQFPFHVALLALAATALALLAWRAGLVRWGRALTAITAACAAAALAVAGLQIRDAARAGADISVTEVFTELGYPGATPDESTVYASPAGQPLTVDAYLPKAAPGVTTPAIVLAHAGGFRTFDKSDLRGTARWLADHGVAAYAVDYRLATATTPTWDKAPQDLVCALGWAHDNAARHHVDPDRISLGGMSAGGALALNAAYRLFDRTITSSCGPAPAPPASVVGFYPGVDVTQMWASDVDGSREAATWFTGGTPSQQPGRYREVSPSAHVQPGLMPTLLVVGDRDRGIATSTITDFGAALARDGVAVEVQTLAFGVHAFDDAYGSVVAQTSRQILLDFLTPA